MMAPGNRAGVGILIQRLLVGAAALLLLLTQGSPAAWQGAGVAGGVPTWYDDPHRFPGCYVEYGLGRWPPPGYPCAGTCAGGRPYKPAPGSPTPSEACLAAGPSTKWDVDVGNRQCTIRTGRRKPRLSLLRIIYPRGHKKCKQMTGDPHARTFDGVRYDLQAAGEFVGIKSLDDRLEVQYRLKPIGRPPRVSLVSAVAARVGDHRVVLALPTGTRLRVDGEAVDLPDGEMMYLTEDEDAVLVRQGERYTVLWPDDSNLHVDMYRSYLNTYFLASEARDGRLVGLFGDADGDASNDFRTRDGRPLDSPPEFRTLYQTFAESWRVRPTESLFDYGPGESTETFTDRSVPVGPAGLENLDPAVRDRAEAACRSAGVTGLDALEECIIDVGYSGDEAFIASALSLQAPPELTSASWSRVEPIASGLCHPAPAATAAASFRANAARTGRFAAGLSGFRGEPLWNVGGFRSGHEPLVVDGRVIAAKARGIVALDAATGRQVWQESGSGGRIAGQGFVAAGGAVFAARENALAAYDLDAGTECWRLPIGPSTAPAYAEGRLYVSVDEGETGYVAAVNASSGRVVWRWDARNPAPANWPSPTAPTVGGDAVFVADGGEIVALDRVSGRVLWRTATGSSIREGLAYADGVVYAPAQSGLHALDAATGAARWVFREPGMIVPNAVALSDQLVYVADERHFHAIERASGSEAWKIDAQRTSRFNAPVVAGERLYAITHQGDLVVLDLGTGAEIHRVQVIAPRTFGWSVPTAGPNGLFFVLPNGTLSAYR